MSSTPSRWKQVPFAASVLVICGLLVCGGIYLVNYRERDAYITSRNFRLLAVLAQQTESAIDAHFHTRRAARGNPDLTGALEVGPGRPAIVMRFKKSPPDIKPVAEILKAVFTPKLEQGAYDTLALAMPDGRIAFAAGKREWELSSMNLAMLLPERPVPAEAAATAPATPEATAFSRIAVLDADIAGVPYQMFIQPCCQLVAQETAAGAVVVGLVASDAIRAEAMAISPTLLVIASLLVALAFLAWPFLSIAMPGPRRRVSRLDALQLGFSGTVGLSIATILAVTSVQCAQLESDVEHQLKALASELDQELVAEITSSAQTLDALEAWLGSCPPATRHARYPEDYPVQYPKGYRLGAVVEPNCTATSASQLTDVDAGYRNYDVAALIDKHGRQVRKAWPKAEKPPLVDVSDRPYFNSALAYSLAPLMRHALGAGPTQCTGPPCVLQSLVSYTTGQPSAVLARPSRLGGSLPVAAITLPMRSVIGPVIPHGFEFAVIDKTGRVVFHSDAQRNTFEDLFLETDRNRQLRSLVVTGVDGSVRTEYWGRPYLAHVKHAQAYGWSVVTLFDRRTLRGLMLEWTMVSLLFLGGYSVLWASAVVLAVTTGGAWLWPDRFRKRRYGWLSAFYLLLIVGFGLAFVSSSLSRSTIALAGFAVPTLACVVSVLVLKGRPAARVDMARLDYQYDYCIAGALLLVVTGILPGAAFVARSYDAHIEAYLKHRQLGVVQALTTRPSIGTEPARVSATPGETTAARELTGWHGRFLYQTSLCREAGTAHPPSDGSEPARDAAVAATRLETCEEEAAPPLDLPSIRSASLLDWSPMPGGDPAAPNPTAWQLEHYLPYFSEMSVQIRELVRRRADDGSWTSQRVAQQTVLRVPQQRTGRVESVRATTVLPPLAIAHRTATVLPILLALAALAYGVALFIARYVFLGAVTAPMWALGRLAVAEGKTVILLCDPQAMAPRIHGAARLSLVAALSGTDRSRATERAEEEIDRSEHANGPILVTDLDAGAPGPRELADRTQLLCALVRARTRAVVVLSAQPLPELAAGINRDPESAPDASAALDAAIGALETCGVIVLDWRAHPGAADGPLTLSATRGTRGWWRRLTAQARQASTTIGSGAGLVRRPDPEGEALLRAEERVHPGLRAICDSIRRLDAFRENRLSRSELLDEIDERAEALYGELWTSCSDTEKLELRHIAQFGFANPGHSRAVRQLLMKRLLRKDPDLRLMNRTFRRFVVSPQTTGHVAHRDVARIESGLEASAWDQIRGPFVIGVLGLAAFLYFTQRETYNVTMGAAIGLATQVPNLLKAISWVVQKDPALPGGQRNA